MARHNNREHRTPYTPLNEKQMQSLLASASGTKRKRTEADRPEGNIYADDLNAKLQKLKEANERD